MFKGGFPKLIPISEEKPKKHVENKGFSPDKLKSIRQIMKNKNDVMLEEEMANLTDSNITLKYLKMIK